MDATRSADLITPTARFSYFQLVSTFFRPASPVLRPECGNRETHGNRLVLMLAASVCRSRQYRGNMRNRTALLTSARFCPPAPLLRKVSISSRPRRSSLNIFFRFRHHFHQNEGSVTGMVGIKSERRTTACNAMLGFQITEGIRPEIPMVTFFIPTSSPGLVQNSLCNRVAPPRSTCATTSLPSPGIQYRPRRHGSVNSVAGIVPAAESSSQSSLSSSSVVLSISEVISSVKSCPILPAARVDQFSGVCKSFFPGCATVPPFFLFGQAAHYIAALDLFLTEPGSADFFSSSLMSFSRWQCQRRSRRAAMRAVVPRVCLFVLAFLPHRTLII